MKVLDMHCDTILSLLDSEDRHENVSLYKNKCSIDIEKMKKGNYLLQNFALFTDQKKNEIAEHETMRLYDMYCRMLEQNSQYIAPVYCYEDILKNEKEGKISSLLTLEDGGVVFNDLAMLRNYYRMGVRMIALTWNYENGIGYPNLLMNPDFLDSNVPNLLQRVDSVNGLTPFGMEYIAEMEKLGMIIDVSHLNDAGFWDVYDHTTKPFVASHSNARAMCPVARNLSDDMILALKERGGVMGLNFCGDFLELHDKPNGPSRIEAMVDQIKYIKDLAGIDVIALGTDFDGINCECEIGDASQMPLLEQALYDANFTNEEVEKIFYKNALRVYSEVLK
ncbi:dipeptidase [Floccifex sp.]|uniref:dipeptidase n=1 Tax=Floccifex sp. TaxID=2815810 RepID=UPI002A75BED1|nr:dipeptidase [Floccifex sp.]MDD7280633.1 dipeptidase [Erysipelotrichaceae bacterium]MDY2958413.1 dipeptidase [Floccifex sp.]